MNGARSMGFRWFAITAAALFLCLTASFFAPVACRKVQAASAILSQRGYLWQREWTPAVADAFCHANRKMDGVVVLGAEVHWRNGVAHIVPSSIPWEVVACENKPIAIAVRVAPFPGPFAADDASVRAVAGTVRALLAEARSRGVAVAEFQLDFDCAQDKLAGYRVWLRALRPLVRPLPFVITALPSWLDAPDFAALAREVDGYVLQVHSVPTAKETGRDSLCDPALARKWVAKAERLGLPFFVALPTYRCLAGFGPAGNLLGISMDSVQPAWPPNTRIAHLSADADDLAGLVSGWTLARPSQMAGILWYRIPVATDVRNWRWPTLAAVMDGRAPLHKLEISQVGENPIDFSVVNSGEADEWNLPPVVVTWDHAALLSGDALAGWALTTSPGRAEFRPCEGGILPPGAKRAIGWLRYDRPTHPKAVAGGTSGL